MEYVEVKPVSVGFSWTVYSGVENDENGNTMLGTADSIVGGWEPSEAEARNAAKNSLGGE